MGQYFCKLLTDKGDFYMIFCSVISQFTTPAVRSTDSRIGFEPGEDNVFDLREKTLKKVEKLLQKLESGKSVTIPEARVLYQFNGFLDGTVADHQYNYPETSDEKLEEWVKELKLRERFPTFPARDIVKDRGLFPAFQHKVHNAYRRKRDRLSQVGRATVSQNRIAARYVRTMATIANALGPKRSDPEDIVKKFFEITQTRKPGT